MRKFKLFLSLLMLLTFSVGNVWGTEYEEITNISSGTVVGSSNTSYKAYSSTDWLITFGGNKVSVGTNGNSRSNCKLSSYSKYAVSPVTTSSTASVFVNKTSLSDVSKIKYTFNGGSNQASTNVYLIYSSDNSTFSQMSLSSGTQGAAISSGTEYEFAKCSGYFGLLFVATNTSGNWRIDNVNITFYTNEDEDPGSSNPTVSAEHLAWAKSSEKVFVDGETYDNHVAHNALPALTYDLSATLAYASTETGVATISNAGEITIVGEGTTTISATYPADDDYSETTVSYELTVDKVRTVAGAITKINYNTTGYDNQYVKGIICQVDQKESNNSITYWISDDGTKTTKLEVYKGLGINKATFSSKDDLQEGDRVVVKGKLVYFSSGSVNEFASGSEILSLARSSALYNGANGATKVGDYTSGTNALPTTAADVAGWTFDGNWSKVAFASKSNDEAYAEGTYFAGGATTYSGANLYAIYRRTPTVGSTIYSTQPAPGYALSLDPATGDKRISADKDLAFIPVGTSVTLTAVGGLVTEWKVYDKDVNDITSTFTYTSSTSTSFVFNMPAQEILVEATMCALPAEPTNLATSLHDGGNRGKTVFTWSPASGATKYTLTYTKVGSDPVEVSNIANATHTINPLAVGEYTWSVKSVNDCGASEAANGEGFTICMDFAAVTPTVGAATSIAQTTATANWTAVAAAAKYTVQVYNGETKVAEYENETGTSKAITGLTANTSYVVKVTAYNACGEASLVGTSAEFTTSKNVYTVTFNANGGVKDELQDGAVNVTDGEATTLPSSGFTKAGFSLSGWKVNNEGALLEKGASYTVTGAATLYAQWSPNTITVTYKPNGPTADDVEESFTYGNEYNTKAANTFSRSGYQFKHWNNAADGSGDVTLVAGAAYTGTEDITLYAIWDQLYTVSWVVNGGDPVQQTAIAGTALTAAPVPTASDCDNSKAFVGWTETQHYTDATDAPTDLFDYENTLTMPVGGATYYAVFADVEEGSELQDKELEITTSTFTEISTNYSSTYKHTYSLAASSGNTNVEVQAYGVYKNNGIQMNTGKGTYIKNNDALPGYIKQIKMTWASSSKNSPTVYADDDAVASTSSTSLGKQANDVTEQTINITNPSTANYKYFYFDGTTVSGACVMTSLKITYAVEVDATVRTNYATDCNVVLPVCEEPTFNVAEGEYNEVKNVTIETATEDATIYYTTDGTNPATSETKETYSSPVRVDHTLTLKAVAVKEGYVNSTVKSADYTINLPQCATPTFSVAAGRYTAAQSVELSCETTGAAIYYTTDGETPTTGSTLYTAAISVSADMTIKAVALAENTTLSEVATAAYKIVGPGSTLWELVEDENDLNDGDIIVIASNAQGKTMNSTLSSGYFGQVATTFSSDKSLIEEMGTGTAEYILSKSGNNWKLYNETQENYLASTANKSMSYTSSGTAWAITIDDGDATISAGVLETGKGESRIIHNVNNTRFTTYNSETSASMLLPQIYRKTVVCEDPETELAFATSVPTAIDASEKAQLATTGGNGSDVTYSVISNNASAATIDNENKFSAVVAGTYTIQARQAVSNDFKCAQTATMEITVTVAATGVELNKSALSLEEGQFETLTATVAPSDASNKNVTWSVTEGSDYIEVDENGKVTAKAIGSGTVQVETEDGHFTATCAVTVTAPTPILTLTATNPLEFGNVEPNLTKDLTVNLKGSYLVADAAYEITGDDKDFFSVVTTLDNDVIGSEDGQTLTIRFAPTAEGDKNATITFTSGVASQSLTVTGTGKKRYTATLHAGNGSVTNASIQETAIGAGITLPEATLSQTLQGGGWSFVGWAEAEIANETDEEPTTIEAGAYAIASDIDLYAIYTRDAVVEGVAACNVTPVTTATVMEENKPVTWKCSDSNTFGNPLRLYSNNSITFAGKQGTTIAIKSVTFTMSQGSATSLQVNSTNLTSNTWTGNAEEVIFTNSSSSQVRISSVSVEYQTSEDLYTTYPAELFTVEYALNGGTGNFSNQMVVKGNNYTIDAAEPTKEHHDFLGWSDGTTTYQAAETIENVQSNITLTAQWNEWSKANATFMNGENIVAVRENVYKGENYTTPAAPNVDGKLFQGWSDGENTFAAEVEITMSDPAVAVTYNALWQDILPTPTAPQITAADLANGEWILITAASQINTGDVVIVAQVSDESSIAAMGTQHVDGDKVWRDIVSNIEKSDNKITPTSDVPMLFVQVGYENAFALYAINGTTGYLFDPQTSGKNYLNTSASLTTAASWTITINGDYQAAVKNVASNKYLCFNSDRFSCYNTNSNNISLYKWVKKISGTTSIEDVTLTDAVIVPNGATLNVPTDAELENVIVENGGKVTVATGKELTVNDLTIESTAGNSGQLTGDGNVTVNGDIYMEIKFYTSSNGNTLNATEANQWYMISAPFAVNLNGGFQQIDGTPMVFGQDFDLFYYDGQKRADNGSNGWARVSGQMLAGRACLIGFNEGQSTTIRLKAASNEISDPTSITLGTFNGDDANKNWNGVANPRFRYTNVDKDVHVWNNEEGTELNPGRKYTVFSASQYSFVVGTPFFVQDNTSITLSDASHSELRAPKRSAANERIEYCVRITREGATEFADQMYVRASEESTNTYEQGHDLVTWNDASGKSALIWSENYGMRLAIEEAPMVNNKASYKLGIYAPAAGSYTISVPTEREDATVYLTREGRVIWNLSMSEYTGSFEKGNNAGYGIRIVRAPQVGTGVENTSAAEAGVQKVIIDEHVYILRGEQLFDVNGKMVK